MILSLLGDNAWIYHMLTCKIKVKKQEESLLKVLHEQEQFSDNSKRIKTLNTPHDMVLVMQERMSKITKNLKYQKQKIISLEICLLMIGTHTHTHTYAQTMAYSLLFFFLINYICFSPDYFLKKDSHFWFTSYISAFFPCLFLNGRHLIYDIVWKNTKWCCPQRMAREIVWNSHSTIQGLFLQPVVLRPIWQSEEAVWGPKTPDVSIATVNSTWPV